VKIIYIHIKNYGRCQVLVAYACYPSYLGGRLNWGGLRFEASWGNSSRDSISKITKVKWTGTVAQEVECLLCHHKALSSTPSLIKKFIKKARDVV
jgi:hypothetical protein